MTDPKKKRPKKKKQPAGARKKKAEPGVSLEPYVAPEPDPERRVFDEAERSILGDQLADIFEKAGLGPFADARQHRRAVSGRPPKLTAERALTILRSIMHDGASYVAACALADVDVASFKRWRSKGADKGGDPLYRAFRAALARATAYSEGTLTQLMKRHAITDFRAAAWLLERRFPKRYPPPALSLKNDKDAPLFPETVEFRLVPAGAAPGVAKPREPG